MLAECLNSPAEFSAGGRPWPLLITHGVLLRVGTELGIDALAGGLDVLHLSAREARVLLWAALSAAGCGLTIEQVGALISCGSIGPLRLLLLSTWVGSMPVVSPHRKASGDVGGPLGSLRAWAVARIELGVSDAEWLAMTPRQARALSDARLGRMQREELLVGILAAAAANFGFCRPDPPLRAADFMLHGFDEGGEEDSGLTGEKIMKWRERGARNARHR